MRNSQLQPSEEPKSGLLSIGKGTAEPRNKDTKVGMQESRRRYRERAKIKAIETKANYEKAVEELARLKHEQVQLQNENSVLESMCKYSEAVINLIRNAASSISTIAADSAWQIRTAAQTSLMAAYGDLADTIWSKFLRPTDAQLRTMVKLGNFTPVHQTIFLDRLCNAIKEWQTSSPAGREVIERKLFYTFDTRARLCRILIEEKPEFIRNLFSTAKGLRLEAQRHWAVLQQNQLLNNEDLIAASALTEGQRIALHRHWKIYLAHIQKTKGAVKKGALELDANLQAVKQGALPNEPVGSLSEIAKSQLALHRTVSSLEEFSMEEMIARVNLGLGCVSVLRPIQQAYLTILAIPSCDMLNGITTIYKSLLKLEGAAFDVKHDYEIENGTGGDHSTSAAIGS
jgi:hypothetical protein